MSRTLTADSEAKHSAGAKPEKNGSISYSGSYQSGSLHRMERMKGVNRAKK
jgi:hypothetical protein